MNGRLVSRQTRVQHPDSYICAKLVDFALSAVEEMVQHFDVTTSDHIIPTLVLVTWRYVNCFASFGQLGMYKIMLLMILKK